MGHDEWAQLDAVAQAELVRRREVTPRELVDAAIERATQDSAVAVFARQGELISIGRTNTPELALLPTTGAGGRRALTQSP